MNKTTIGKKNISPFTIPSGIITTEVSTIEKFAREIPELGIITTKTIGKDPRPGNVEPILHQYAPGSFVNAVGLKNPGCEAFANKLSQISFPIEKFFLISVMGTCPEDFCHVVRALDPYADGFELNLSCPHAKGYGQQIGNDATLVFQIVQAVARTTTKPVFAKLSPNVDDLALIAKKAMEAGAYGIAVINTAGPDLVTTKHGDPVLSNKVGGRSGKDILPIGLKCVKTLRDQLGDIPILGMGGIRTAKDVLAYRDAGARYFGIGSALAGLRDREIKAYFSALAQDVETGTRIADSCLKEIQMQHVRTQVTQIQHVADDFKIISFDLNLNSLAGQFVFVWLPGVAEKPFSVLDDNPLTIAVQERGKCTRAINELKAGDPVYIRGPHGTGFTKLSSHHLVLVGGGSGIAGLYLFAKHFASTHKITTLIGTKDDNHIFYKKEFEQCGDVLIATEDGSLGKKGFVTELFSDVCFDRETQFINCGPLPMIEAVTKIESQITTGEHILSSIDYLTMCGVGICGTCADSHGTRSCVEGPFY